MRLKPIENEALGGLLMDFLGYYGHDFDYEGSVVSVKEGKLLTKEEKGWVNPHNQYSLAIECILNPGERLAPLLAYKHADVCIHRR